MFTVCSKCDLRLTVTPADLRAAQGYVRCGRCHNVFNALAALSEETVDSTGAHRTNTATAAPAAATSAPSPEPTPAAGSGAPEQPAPPGSVGMPEPASAPADADLEFNASATDVSSIFVAAPQTPGTGTFESIILRGSQPDDNTDEVRVLHLPSEELAALAAVAEAAMREDELELADPSPAAEPYALDEPAPQGLNGPSQEAPVETSPEAAGPAAQPETAADAATHAAADPFTTPAPQQVSGLPSWLLPVACVVLTLALVAQMVNHWRDNLAAGPPRRPITALYTTLGIPLSPQWDVSDYEVRQLGAQAAQSGEDLEVHASIRNKSRRAQPLPLLRVTLEDQFGNRVAARDLTPAEYLGKGVAGGMLAPYAQVEAVAAFVDPGRNAVGFELDACLKLRTGRIVCANDPARAAP